MSDYFLNKIYDSVLKNRIKKQSTFKTLSESYVSIYEQETEQQIPNSTNTATAQPNASIEKEPNIQPPQQNISSNSAFKGLTEELNTKICKVLGTTEVPLPKGDYKDLKSGSIDSQDLAIFKKLYPLIPSKKDASQEVGTKGSGNGEIALYWLLGKNHTIQDNRSMGKPDLLMNGTTGIEVKSFLQKGFSLGKYKSQKENRSMLSIILGVQALFSIAEIQPSKGRLPKVVGIDVFNSTDLQKAFEQVIDLYKLLLSPDNKNLLQFDIINNLYEKISSIFKQLTEDTSVEKLTAENLTAKVLRRILVEKLSTKPGFEPQPGYIVNVLENGQLSVYLVDYNKLLDATTEKAIIKNIVVGSGEIIINNPQDIFKQI